MATQTRKPKHMWHIWVQHGDGTKRDPRYLPTMGATSLDPEEAATKVLRRSQAFLPSELQRWVECKRREARRQIRIAKKTNFVAGYEITHQHGRLAVLAELVKWLSSQPRKAEKSANGLMSDSGEKT